MIAPAAPPTAAPMIAPRAVEPVWFPMTPPTAAPVAAPMTAPFSLLELIAAQPVRATASETALMIRMDIRAPSMDGWLYTGITVQIAGRAIAPAASVPHPL